MQSNTEFHPILTPVLLTLWSLAGFYAAWHSRDDTWGIKGILFVLFFPSMTAFYSVYIFVILYRIVRGFSAGIQEGRAEKQDERRDT